jgi:hypothetical protein
VAGQRPERDTGGISLSSRHDQGSSYHPTAQSLDNEQLHGVYLGVVTHTRQQDLWVKISIPQLLGDQDSNWARPAGFNSVGSLTPPAAAWDSPAPLPWGGFTGQQGSGQPVGWSAAETGPGPPPGSLVVVMFIGGDRNRPAYLLTSQHVG